MYSAHSIFEFFLGVLENSHSPAPPENLSLIVSKFINWIDMVDKLKSLWKTPPKKQNGFGMRLVVYIAES